MLFKGTQGSCTYQTEEQYNKTKTKVIQENKLLRRFVWKKHFALPDKITQFLLIYFTSIPDKTQKNYECLFCSTDFGSWEHASG